MMPRQQPLLNAVADSLLRLEAALRQAEVWCHQEPAAEALQSTQPFCVDTLEFPQWLQFVFLRRMHALVAQGAALPRMSGIAPMAEEHFRAQPVRGQESVLRELAAIDQLLSSAGPEGAG